MDLKTVRQTQEWASRIAVLTDRIRLARERLIGLLPGCDPELSINQLVELVAVKLDPFTPAAIDQAARDQERFDAGYKAGYEAAELRQRQLRETDDPVMAEMEKRRRLLEAYRLVKADLESFPGPTPRACLGFAEGRIDALEYAE